MDPQVQTPTPQTNTETEPQSPKGPSAITVAGSAVADYGGRHSSDFKIFIKKWLLWLINFLRFVFVEFFKEIFNRS